MNIIRHPFTGAICLILYTSVILAPSAAWCQTKSSTADTLKGTSLHTVLSTYTYADSTLFSDSGRQSFYKRSVSELELFKNSIYSTNFPKIPLTIKIGDSILFHNHNSLLRDASYKKDFLHIHPKSREELLKFNGGYVQYNWSFRSGLDTAYIGSDLSQHLSTANASFTIANTLPIRINYFGRETNSKYFKSYRDLRIDIDVQQYQTLRKQKMLTAFKSYIQGLENPLLPYAVKVSQNRLATYQAILEDPKVIKKLIESKEILLKENFRDTSFSYKDSIHLEAKNFIYFYDSLQAFKKKYEILQDSLQLVMQTYESKIRSVEHLVNGSFLSPATLVEMSALYGKGDNPSQKLLHVSDGIKLFSIGKTFPSYSNLTLANVNVNGLNIEYNHRTLFLAIAAGRVDFRLRDFLFEKEQKPVSQYIYFGKVGYGKKEYNHIAISYFTGRKQFIGSTSQGPSGIVQGLSISAQVFLNKNTRIYGELAQSGSSLTYSSPSIEKPGIRLTDNSQKAYAFSLNSYLPQTHTTIEGYFQKTGLNYQCFNSFQYNAAVNSWSGKIEQPIWKRQLVLLASVRKNDFTNPFLLQRYNANTVFKTAMLTFRKQRWPMISLGYLPVSQNIILGNQVFENHFQCLTGNANYQYTIGLARSFTTLMYSQYYNESYDSGFVYFNSKNIFWNQSFAFDGFSVSMGASVMQNRQYQLSVLDGGIHTILFKAVNLDVSVKVNHLKREDAKFGFKTGSGFVLKNIGEINVWMEKSYLPAEQNNLSKYEMYNLGFTRFFK